MDDLRAPSQTDPQPEAKPYDDTEDNRDAVQTLVKRRFGDFSHGRENFLWPAFRNIFFYRGRQWIRFDRAAVTGWRPIRPRDPSTPLPVTNKFRRIVNACFSMTARFEPSLNFAPGSDDADDRAAADMASRAIDVIEDEVNITTHRQAQSKWFWLTGGVWRETGYDNDMAHGTVQVPMDVCPQCGDQQPPAPMIPMEQGAPAVDAMGNQPSDAMGGPLCAQCNIPIAQQPVAMPKGRMYVEARSVFEMFFDPSITDWAKQRDYVCQNAVDVERAKARWPKIKDSIKPDTTASNMFMETLPTLGPNFDDNRRWATATGGRITNTKVTENWYYRLPDETYPEGLLAVLLGKTPGQYAYHGPLTTFFEDEDGGKDYFLPHDFFAQDEVPGSAWPATIADDLADKQRERNQWEMMIRLAGMKMSNPIWMVQRGSAMSSPTGQSGQVVEFTLVPGGRPPERVDGRPITASWSQCIARIDQEMNDLAAQADILRGERPTGVNTALQSQLLKERAESQFGPMFVKWNHAEAQWARKALAIFKQHATEPRLRKIKGEDGEWEVQKFLAADLRGRVDVMPEAGVSLPHTTLSERSEAQEAIQMGLLNPQEPETRRALQKKFKLLDYQPNLSRDIRNAAIENEQFVALATNPAVASASPDLVQKIKQTIQLVGQAGQPPTVALAMVEQMFASIGLEVPQLLPHIDAHDVHGQEHRTDAKAQDFKKRPELVRVFEELHIQAHDFLQGQAMQSAREAQRKININLKGDLSPNDVARFAGDAGPLSPQQGPQQHEQATGNAPGPRPGSPPSTPAAAGPSGPNRLRGEHAEMQRRM